MQGTYDEERDEITVTLSYKNVEQLYAAKKHMRRESRNLFTLSKQQEDGVTVVVAVAWEAQGE